MNIDLKPYPDYKDSGLEWLGSIPVHWDILRCKYVFREVDDRSEAGEETHLSMSQQYGLVPSSKFSERRLYSETYAGGKLCQVNDLVLNRLKAHLGVFAHAREPGVVSPDYTVLRPLLGDDVVFFEMVFKTPPYVAELRRSTKGIVEGFWRLYTDDFYNVRVPVPPPQERDAILRFIRVFDRKVQRLIRNRRRLIEVLNEQKQGIISRAVTLGLDPNAPLKPSGIDWLGDIPEHWEVVSLRLRYAVQLGKMLDTKRITGEHLVSYLRNTDVQWGRINTSELPRMDVRPNEYQRYTVRFGDLLVCEGGEVGRAAIWEKTEGIYGYQKALHRLRPLHSDQDYPPYLYFVLFDIAKRGIFHADGSENTIAHLTAEKLRRHRFAFPNFDEQLAIVEHINKELEAINGSIKRIDSEIFLVREYRTRFIAEVVTGKIDIRDLAQALGDGEGEFEPEDMDEAIGENEILEDIERDIVEESADADY